MRYDSRLSITNRLRSRKNIRSSDRGCLPTAGLAVDESFPLSDNSAFAHRTHILRDVLSTSLSRPSDCGKRSSSFRKSKFQLLAHHLGPVVARLRRRCRSTGRWFSPPRAGIFVTFRKHMMVQRSSTARARRKDDKCEWSALVQPSKQAVSDELRQKT